MAEKEEGNFLIKIDKLVNGSYAFKVFLKPNDIIVALDNQFYTFGEKQLTSEVKRALKVWIPQVSLTNISFPEVIDNKKVVIRLEYVIPGYDIQDEVTLEVQ